MQPDTPITDTDLHAYVDGQLPDARVRAVEAHLAVSPEDARRVAAWRSQNDGLRAMFENVAREPVPGRLRVAAAPPRRWAWRVAAGVAIAFVGGAAGWGLRGEVGGPAAAPELEAFARRAAVAHAVFVPEQRRPVEVAATQEDQLVTWLSKRMGTPMKPPHLAALGYTLEGGRLLPGGAGPVAQFMYRDAAGTRLTLYVSNELPRDGAPARPDTAFRFAQDGPVHVFYWVDGPFGYALSSFAPRAELARVSAEVYRQLGAAR